MEATVKVYNRKLEQCLFALGVDFLSCDKTDDNITVWTYPRNEKTEQIIQWFKGAAERRKNAGW